MDTTSGLHGIGLGTQSSLWSDAKVLAENWLFCTRGAVKVTPSDPEPKVKPGDLGPIAASKPSILPKLEKMAGSSLQIHVDNWLAAAGRTEHRCRGTARRRRPAMPNTTS